MSERTNVGRVLGKDDAHPLDFWVGVGEDSYLQLDDVVAVTTEVPGRGKITLYGVVDRVRARHEGARFDSDVFLEAEGVLPLGVATAAHIAVTRIEPEVFVPPRPGNGWRAPPTLSWKRHSTSTAWSTASWQARRARARRSSATLTSWMAHVGPT
jgi:hypothetical protein